MKCTEYASKCLIEGYGGPNDRKNSDYKAARTMTIPRTTCATIVLVENRKSTRPAENRKTGACRSNGIPFYHSTHLKILNPFE